MYIKLRILILVSICLAVFLPCSFAAQSYQVVNHLVKIQEIDPTIDVELVYATTHNFTQQQVYPLAVGVLREETAIKLAQANHEFKKDGYRLKVWDGYRPPTVQKIFWKLVPDDRYVANPYKGGSKHNRGGAVDVTLVDKEGNKIEMPSSFDDFSDKAWPNNPMMSPQAKKNMDYLRKIMIAHGFDPIEHEWWHFDDQNWKKYPLVDVPFEEFISAPSILDEAEVRSSNQVLIVRLNPNEVFKGTIEIWQRKKKQWKLIMPPVDAVLGRNGIAQVNAKAEGDGYTPNGIFNIKRSFGYLKKIQTRLSYQQVVDEDIWVDDPSSTFYNQWIRKSKASDVKSFENLKRSDNLYEFGAVIEYNTEVIKPGAGSAIFLHVWRDKDHPTAGCVAVSRENMIKILKLLNINQHPKIIIQTT